ncbi:YegP family protein [Pseudarthrobacter oxydans]|uniref:YegP family protein n=1 Tax=Pseudarthrobacter oxydans TaxID=1671 RepID=UPI003829E803
MAGKFEAFVDSDSSFRFRLLAPDGAVMAVSGPYQDKAALAAGIAAVRECAGTGLVTDLCSTPGVATRQAPARVPAPAEEPATAAPRTECDDQRVPAGGHTFVLAKGPRRQGTRPRWTASVR